MYNALFEYDNALTEEQCKNIIDLFESSEHKKQGVVGSKTNVDTSIKRSIDLNVSPTMVHIMTTKVTNVILMTLSLYSFLGSSFKCKSFTLVSSPFFFTFSLRTRSFVINTNNIPTKMKKLEIPNPNPLYCINLDEVNL